MGDRVILIWDLVRSDRSSTASQNRAEGSIRQSRSNFSYILRPVRNRYGRTGNSNFISFEKSLLFLLSYGWREFPSSNLYADVKPTRAIRRGQTTQTRRAHKTKKKEVFRAINRFCKSKKKMLFATRLIKNRHIHLTVDNETLTKEVSPVALHFDPK